MSDRRTKADLWQVIADLESQIIEQSAATNTAEQKLKHSQSDVEALKRSRDNLHNEIDRLRDVIEAVMKLRFPKLSLSCDNQVWHNGQYINIVNESEDFRFVRMIYEKLGALTEAF